MTDNDLVPLNFRDIPTKQLVLYLNESNNRRIVLYDLVTASKYRM
jgi:hypothetical protein